MHVRVSSGGPRHDPANGANQPTDIFIPEARDVDPTAFNDVNAVVLGQRYFLRDA